MALMAGCGDEPAPATPQEGAGAPTPRASASGCARPYAETSPWNRRIGSSPDLAPEGERHVRAIEGPLTSDPTQYTYPVYKANASTPRAPVAFTGWFSKVSEGGTRLDNEQAPTVELPIPEAAEPAAGTDAQIILLDPATGDEWGVWRLERGAEGWEATNGYHYNTRWSGVPPLSEGGSPFVSRGAGVPYLAGLVRPCELAHDRIEHALAFAYDFPSKEFVYPATKSDGQGHGPGALPEGTRLQLDPSLTESMIQAWGCTAACLTIARALQEYGMYVIDNSGRPKVMLEYEATADWDGMVGEATVSPIPLTAFRVVPPERPPGGGTGGR